MKLGKMKGTLPLCVMVTDTTNLVTDEAANLSLILVKPTTTASLPLRVREDMSGGGGMAGSSG